MASSGSATQKKQSTPDAGVEATQSKTSAESLLQSALSKAGAPIGKARPAIPGQKGEAAKPPKPMAAIPEEDELPDFEQELREEDEKMEQAKLPSEVVKLEATAEENKQDQPAAAQSAPSTGGSAPGGEPHTATPPPTGGPSSGSAKEASNTLAVQNPNMDWSISLDTSKNLALSLSHHHVGAEDSIPLCEDRREIVQQMADSITKAERHDRPMAMIIAKMMEHYGVQVWSSDLLSKDVPCLPKGSLHGRGGQNIPG